LFAPVDFIAKIGQAMGIPAEELSGHINNAVEELKEHVDESGEFQGDKEDCENIVKKNITHL